MGTKQRLLQGLAAESSALCNVYYSSEWCYTSISVLLLYGQLWLVVPSYPNST